MRHFYRDPHADDLPTILDFTTTVTRFISSWAWSCSQSDEGGNLDPSVLEGLAMLTGHLATLQHEALQHDLERCACFKPPRQK